MKVTIEPNSHIPFYSIPAIADGGDVKTFSGKMDEIRGIIARDVETNEVVKLSSIYYDIRTVKNRYRQTVAKRKNPDDELKSVKVKR